MAQDPCGIVDCESWLKPCARWHTRSCRSAKWRAPATASCATMPCAPCNGTSSRWGPCSRRQVIMGCLQQWRSSPASPRHIAHHIVPSPRRHIIGLLSLCLGEILLPSATPLALRQGSARHAAPHVSGLKSLEFYTNFSFSQISTAHKIPEPCRSSSSAAVLLGGLRWNAT